MTGRARFTLNAPYSEGEIDLFARFLPRRSHRLERIRMPVLQKQRNFRGCIGCNAEVDTPVNLSVKGKHGAHVLSHIDRLH